MSVLFLAGGFPTLKLVVPKATRDSITSMTRATLSTDVHRYLAASLQRIGNYAVINAKSLVGTMNGGLAATHDISAAVRGEKGGRRGMGNAPLYDSGDMRKSIRGVLNTSTLELTVGTKGKKAWLGMLHERGYDFRITPGTIQAFDWYGTRAGEKRDRAGAGHRDHQKLSGAAANWLAMWGWAKRHEGEVIHVQARPFIRPSVEKAMDRFMAESEPFARGLMSLWMQPGAAAGRIGWTARMGVNEPEPEFADGASG